MPFNKNPIPKDLKIDNQVITYSDIPGWEHGETEEKDRAKILCNGERPYPSDSQSMISKLKLSGYFKANYSYNAPHQWVCGESAAKSEGNLSEKIEEDEKKLNGDELHFKSSNNNKIKSFFLNEDHHLKIQSDTWGELILFTGKIPAINFAGELQLVKKPSFRNGVYSGSFNNGTMKIQIDTKAKEPGAYIWTASGVTYSHDLKEISNL